jgi:uncharacterized protein (DUF4213/DUF364 family)
MQNLDKTIFDCFREEAGAATVDKIHLGLGYSAVTLSDGRCGLCCTLGDPSSSCTVNKNSSEYEGGPALDLLQNIFSRRMLDRVMAIALANALNAPFASACPVDPGTLETDLQLPENGKVAMVGYFEPIVRILEAKGHTVKAYDIGKRIGTEQEFYEWAAGQADAMILTATSLIFGNTEQVLDRMEKHRVPTVLMGPSTIVHPSLYEGTGITICAGTVPTDIPSTIKAIRNGRGTPVLHRYAKKVRSFVSR